MSIASDQERTDSFEVSSSVDTSSRSDVDGEVGRIMSVAAGAMEASLTPPQSPLSNGTGGRGTPSCISPPPQSAEELLPVSLSLQDSRLLFSFATDRTSWLASQVTLFCCSGALRSVTSLAPPLYGEGAISRASLPPARVDLSEVKRRTQASSLLIQFPPGVSQLNFDETTYYDEDGNVLEDVFADDQEAATALLKKPVKK